MESIYRPSFFHNHVPPIDIYYFDLLVGDDGESIGIICPEYFVDFLSHFQLPLDLFSHSIKHNYLTAVQQNQRTSFPIKFSMSFFLE